MVLICLFVVQYKTATSACLHHTFGKNAQPFVLLITLHSRVEDKPALARKAVKSEGGRVCNLTGFHDNPPPSLAVIITTVLNY